MIVIADLQIISSEMQEDGWVVCRVFKKKNYQRGFNPAEMAMVDEDELPPLPVPVLGGMPTELKHNPHLMRYDFPSFDPSMQLPQLMNTDQPVPALLPGQPGGIATTMSSLDVECSQNLMKLTTNGSDGMLHEGGGGGVNHRFIPGTTDWSILDKLLASHQNLDQLFQGKQVTAASAAPMAPYHQQLMELGGTSSLQRLPLQYHGSEAPDLLRFPK
jgi:hypothetical protein